MWTSIPDSRMPNVSHNIPQSLYLAILGNVSIIIGLPYIYQWSFIDKFLLYYCHARFSLVHFNSELSVPIDDRRMDSIECIEVLDHCLLFTRVGIITVLLLWLIVRWFTIVCVCVQACFHTWCHGDSFGWAFVLVGGHWHTGCHGCQCVIVELWLDKCALTLSCLRSIR